MGQLTVLLVVMAVTAVSLPLAERIRLPYQILLLLLALVPGVPVFEIPPELILPLVLPALLYTAARPGSTNTPGCWAGDPTTTRPAGGRWPSPRGPACGVS